MKAAVCREFGKPLSIEQVNIAQPGPAEVQVRLAACAICHSDILYMDGAWGGPLPAVFGHEAAGVVEQVGSGVNHLKAGDHVIVTLVRSCGGCHFCTRGEPVHCETQFPLDEKSPLSGHDGVPIVQGLRTGAFAEKVVVDVSQVVVVPEDLPFNSASLLACGVITGVGAVTNTAHTRPGDSAVVIGCGGVGLNSVQGAVLCGAQPIIAIDLSEKKLEAAEYFGATHTANAATEDVQKAVLRFTGGRGGDHVFVTVGSKAAIEQGMTLLRKGGKLTVVGMPPSGVETTFEPASLAGNGQSVLGSKMGSSRLQIDVPNLVRFYQQGRLKLDELISQTYTLDQINDAISSVRRGEVLRNVIVF